MNPSSLKILLLVLLLLTVSVFAQERGSCFPDSPADPIDSSLFITYPHPIDSLCPQPEYPVNTQSKGRVIIKVFVNSTGIVKKHVIDVEKPEGLGFKEAVEKVIYQWRFNPAIREGKPKGVWINIPFTFEPPPHKQP